ncbi:MAG: YheV family putative metal-binding protein [Bacteroidales bacterium]|nr:YheV family putative metal-binding protein [Bacteroidales bacterium]
MTVVKRFIAGAVCPRCAAMDRIVMYSADGKQFRECVSCGYQDEMNLRSPPRELDTRVNRSEEERRDEVRPVKLVDPKAG